jgi:hypothetical protein
LIVVVVESAVLPRTCARVVHVAASSEVCRSKSRVSHAGYSPPAPACRITTEPTCCLLPRSVCSHLLAPCEHHLSDQPASTLPLNALSAPSVAPHVESAVAVLRSAMSVGALLLPYTSSS